MADKEKAKGILAKIKALFDGTPPPVVAPAPAAAPPAGAAVVTPCSYNIDGSVPIFVDISADGIPGIDLSDKVYTDAALTIPYADGTYNVTGTQFGFTVAGGIVSAVNDLAGTGAGTPVTAAAAPPPPPPAAATPITQAQMESMAAKFGTGTSEDRLSNIEIMLKALMEDRFGWEIQKQGQAEAINSYRETIQTLQAESQKISDLKLDDRIKKQDETIKGLFDLAEALIGEPTAPPVTLNGNKKEKFDRLQKKDEKFEGILAGIKESSKDKKY